MRERIAVLALLAALLLVFSNLPGGGAHQASAKPSLPPTNVSVSSGQVVVSTTINTSRYDTYVYVNLQGGGTLIFHTSVPATLATSGWSCPCTAQIAYRAKSGTFKVLTAESAPFTPLP